MKHPDKYRIILEREGAMKQPVVVYADENIRVEANALRQLRNTAALDDDAIVLATPDIHTGFGVPIGCVFASPRLISPCAVGYDINCGMRLMTTPFRRGDIDLAALAHSIRRDIPLGEGKRNITVKEKLFDRVLALGVQAVPEVVEGVGRIAGSFDPDEFAHDAASVEDNGSMDGNPDAVSRRAKQRGRTQLATLGGGNHFIEIQIVETVYDAKTAEAFGIEEGRLTIMIHSGSRGLGHQVGGDYMKAARAWDEKQGLALPDRELAYFTIDSPGGKAYFGAMQAAANFAFVNRHLMALLVRRNIRAMYAKDTPLPTVYDVPHNIAKFEHHRGRLYCVHRKGATRAFPPERMRGTRFEKTGQPVLIPGSMGTASYLLVGVPSGSESLFSVNHGAGRTMSRTAAAGKYKKGKCVREPAITDKEFAHSMEGVCLVCEDRRHIKEEAPAAYKDIDHVVEVVKGAGLAEVVARMKPLAVLKG